MINSNKLKEKFNKILKIDSDGIYAWIEEHLIKPHHSKWYEKVGEEYWDDFETISWFINQYTEKDKLWKSLETFLNKGD